MRLAACFSTIKNKIKGAAPKKGRIAVATVCAAALFVSEAFSGHHTLVVKADDVSVQKVDFYQWTMLSETPKKDFRGILMFKSQDVWYYTGKIYWSNDHGGSWAGTKVSDNPYMTHNGGFTTSTDLYASHFIYEGTDGDNAYAPMYAWVAYDENGKRTDKYDEPRYVGISTCDLRIGKDYDEWTVMSKSLSKEKGGSAKFDEDYGFLLFYNKANWSDTDLRFSKGLVYGDYDSDWNGDIFRIFQVEKVKYDCLNKEVTIGSGTYFQVHNDVVLTDGSTMTIEEGGVVSVEGKFYINGKIILKGGTLIVQKDAAMLPFDPEDIGGDIEIQDGGTLIIQSGGRVLAGLPTGFLTAKSDAWVDVRKGGSLINFGLFAGGNVELYDGSTVENHGDARMFLGYSVMTQYGSFSGNKFSPSTKPADLGLSAFTTNVKIHSGATFVTVAGGGYSIASRSLDEACTVVSYDENGKITTETKRP